MTRKRLRSAAPPPSRHDAPAMIRATIALPLLLLLGACGTAVNYGKILHTELASDPVCNPSTTDSAAIADKEFFLVTSRLPDCRGGEIRMTNHRSDKVRFGVFAAPQKDKTAKGKDTVIVPTAFQPEADWWTGLRDAANRRQGRVLLYVHGYRETIDSSSKDTAQIAALTGFDGPVVQYSWPSQGKLLSYAVDETNMYWDERNFRRFLQKLATQDWVKEIVIVGHSLGARLVIPAIEYVDANSASADASNISNIILASPDVDREDFERDIIEEVLSARRVNNDRRITAYVSSNDKALAISRGLHGYPRLGSPYCFNPFEAAALKAAGRPERCYAAKGRYAQEPSKSGLTIIDTSDVNRGGTGHSDYLTSPAACRDFAATVGGARGDVAGREATHLPHVFRLQIDAPKVKGDVAEICKRVP
jgi:esterase/lipase superfamily enzyme